MPVADLLTDHLQQCGYAGGLLRRDYRFGNSHGDIAVPLAGFAHEPPDALSACVAVTDAQGSPEDVVAGLREVGAPVVFVLRESRLLWWRQTPQRPQLQEAIPVQDLSRFFRDHASDLAPDRVYRAKTWGRFDTTYQLDFVDVGLMPLVENQIGRKLKDLVERLVGVLRSALGGAKVSASLGPWLVQGSFWLLAAKILKDKGVPNFRRIDLLDPEDALERVSKHYGSASPPAIGNRGQREALVEAGRQLAAFTSLEHVTAEALAYVYESALVSREIRSELGTHSTPPYLVDYIIWRLAPWIREIPLQERSVFEPACGHAAFLVAALRLLRELLPSNTSVDERKRYLRAHLHGVEIDGFALELARLSLTLADIPNPNGWDLREKDMFEPRVLEHGAASCSIVLTNPPFEDFTRGERTRYSPAGARTAHWNKAAEVLARILPQLKPGAVCGFVLPQGLLHAADAAPIRRQLLTDFEIEEVGVFSDKVFAFSDMESAVILARRVTPGPRRSVRSVRVREDGVERFQQNFAVSSETPIPQAELAARPDFDLRVEELRDVWSFCEHLQKLGDIASVGQGLQHKGRDLPRGANTVSVSRFSGAVPGFARIERGLLLHETPRRVWINVSPDVIRRAGTGTLVRRPQVILNYAPVSRGPWRLKAILDRDGRAVTSRFLTVRPLNPAWPLEFFWAVLNSPFANAFAYSRSSKRDILAGDMRGLPVPRLSVADAQRIASLARVYLDAARGSDTLFVQTDPSPLREVLLQLDAEVLSLYSLPPRLERELLDLFAGKRRLGVPFEFNRYYPPDYAPFIPLAVFLSQDFRRSTAEQLLARSKSEPAPQHLVAALEHAVEAFQE